MIEIDKLMLLEKQIEIARAELNQAEKNFDYVTEDLLNKSSYLDQLVVAYQKLIKEGVQSIC